MRRRLAQLPNLDERHSVPIVSNTTTTWSLYIANFFVLCKVEWVRETLYRGVLSMIKRIVCLFNAPSRGGAFSSFECHEEDRLRSWVISFGVTDRYLMTSHEVLRVSPFRKLSRVRTRKKIRFKTRTYKISKAYLKRFKQLRHMNEVPEWYSFPFKVRTFGMATHKVPPLKPMITDHRFVHQVALVAFQTNPGRVTKHQTIRIKLPFEWF